jgi:hypothetical protein
MNTEDHPRIEWHQKRVFLEFRYHFFFCCLGREDDDGKQQGEREVWVENFLCEFGVGVCV